MMVPKIFPAVAAAAFLLSTSANVTAAPLTPAGDFGIPQRVAENMRPAWLAGAETIDTLNYVEGVDWRNNVIIVVGEAVVPTDAVNFTQAKGLASRGARADAYRKMAEFINGVRVDGETTVEQLQSIKDTVKLKVSATIKGAQVIKEGFLSDGGYRVVMQVPLFGAKDSLANAVMEKPTSIETFPDPVANVKPAEMPYNRDTPVKRRIEIVKVTIEEESAQPTTPYTYTPQQPYTPPASPSPYPFAQRKTSFDALNLQKTSLDTLNLQNLDAGLPQMQQPTYQQPYQPSATPPAQPARRSVADYVSMAEGDYTGLVVDCRGLGLQPVMSPVIKNSNGTKIYGHRNLDIDKIIQMGMADYSSDLEHVDRAGSNPLVVKATAVDNFNSNPVLVIPDSNRVLIENYVTKFLNELKVVFLFD